MGTLLHPKRAQTHADRTGALPILRPTRRVPNAEALLANGDRLRPHEGMMPQPLRQCLRVYRVIARHDMPLQLSQRLRLL
jgi:hypothetical protein